MDDAGGLLACLLGESVDPIVIRMRHEPHQAAQRLLVALGAGWIVDADAKICAKSCGREECRVSDASRVHERVTAMPLSMATLGNGQRAMWQPNWIDYRSSVANVDRRADRSDVAEICRECGCETDVTPVPHSPKCPTLAAAAAASNGGSDVDGLELLERMDAGEPLTDDEIEEPEPGAATATPSGADPAPAAATAEPPSGSSSTNGRAQRGAVQLAVLEQVVAGKQTALLIADAIGRDGKHISVLLMKLAKKGLVTKIRYGVFAATDAGREAAAAGVPLDKVADGLRELQETACR